MSSVTDEYLAQVEERVQECLSDPEKGVRGLELIIEELKKDRLVIEASRVETVMNKWMDGADDQTDE